MRVFILGTGRCGTTTVARAFKHATNYTAAHESRAAAIRGRLDYPDGHIEVDNRLAWFLGPLYQRYPDALYFHLRRDQAETARSYAERFTSSASIVAAFGYGILQRDTPPSTMGDRLAVSRLAVETAQANIDHFLNGLPEGQRGWLELEQLEACFGRLWHRLGCTGDYDAAVAETRVKHNRRRSPRQARAEARRDA